MPAPGMTSELYSDADNPQSVLGAPPPAPPSDVPAPTKSPVMVKERRMADEKADGSIRDTSTEALRAGNDLGFRNLSDEEQHKPEAPAEPTPPVEVVPPPTPEPKTYANGKFKSDADLEKSYLELEKKLTETSQKAAQLEREKNVPPPPAPKSPEQLAAEQAENNRVLEELTRNPKDFVAKIKQQSMQETLTALKAQQITEQWRKDNPDIAQHELRVAFEAAQLMQSDPGIASDPERLFKTATDNFRQFTGKIRTEGAKEALTQETRTIPLLNNTAPTPATEQPAKAPLTADAAYEQHMRMLKAQEQRSHRGLRR